MGGLFGIGVYQPLGSAANPLGGGVVAQISATTLTSPLGGALPGVNTNFYSTAILSKQPILYYHFDELSGSTVADSSGNQLTGRINETVTLAEPGVLAGPGESNGRAIAFDGSTGYILCPSRLSTTGWTTLWVSCWIKLTSAFSGNPRIISNSHTDIDHKGFQLFITSSGTVTFDIGTGSTVGSVTSVSALTVDTWTKLDGTWDGSTLTIFVNGNPEATSSFSGSIGTPTAAIQIARGIYNGDYLPAILDEVVIGSAKIPTTSDINLQYNYALTPGATQIGSGFPMGVGQVLQPLSGLYGGIYGYILYTTIRAPKMTQYTPAPSIGNDPLGNPVVRGFPQMLWTYSTLRPDYWYFFKQLYILAGQTLPAYQYLVLIQYPDLSGNEAPVQILARFDPPTHAYRDVGAYYGVQLRFTYLGQAMLNPGTPIVEIV